MIYVHDEPLSRVARRDTYILKRIGANRKLILELQTGRFVNQHPARIRRKYRREFNIRTMQIHDRQVYIWEPRQASSGKTVLYLHGGAYIHNLLRVHWHLIASLIRLTGATFVLPDYPLAPGHTFRDAYAMVEALYDQMHSMFSEDIIFMGDSAGGGLALGLAQKLRDENKPLPGQLVLYSPWLDVTMSDPESRKVQDSDVLLKISGLVQAGLVWAGEEDPRNPLVSPLFGSFEGLPHLAFFSSTHDILIADAHRLRDKLEQARHPFHYYAYPGMFHGWMAIVHMPEAQHVHRQTAAIIQSVFV